MSGGEGDGRGVNLADDAAFGGGDAVTEAAAAGGGDRDGETPTATGAPFVEGGKVESRGSGDGTAGEIVVHAMRLYGHIPSGVTAMGAAAAARGGCDENTAANSDDDR